MHFKFPAAFLLAALQLASASPIADPGLLSGLASAAKLGSSAVKKTEKVGTVVKSTEKAAAAVKKTENAASTVKKTEKAASEVKTAEKAKKAADTASKIAPPTPPASKPKIDAPAAAPKPKKIPASTTPTTSRGGDLKPERKSSAASSAIPDISKPKPKEAPQTSSQIASKPRISVNKQENNARPVASTPQKKTNAEEAPSKPGKAPPRPERTPSTPEKAPPRPERTPSKPERAFSKPEGAPSSGRPADSRAADSSAKKSATPKSSPDTAKPAPKTEPNTETPKKKAPAEAASSQPKSAPAGEPAQQPKKKCKRSDQGGEGGSCDSSPLTSLASSSSSSGDEAPAAPVAGPSGEGSSRNPKRRPSERASSDEGSSSSQNPAEKKKPKLDEPAGSQRQDSFSDLPEWKGPTDLPNKEGPVHKGKLGNDDNYNWHQQTFRLTEEPTTDFLDKAVKGQADHLVKQGDFSDTASNAKPGDLSAVAVKVDHRNCKGLMCMATNQRKDTNSADVKPNLSETTKEVKQTLGDHAQKQTEQEGGHGEVIAADELRNRLGMDTEPFSEEREAKSASMNLKGKTPVPQSACGPVSHDCAKNMREQGITDIYQDAPPVIAQHRSGQAYTPPAPSSPSSKRRRAIMKRAVDRFVAGELAKRHLVEALEERGLGAMGMDMGVSWMDSIAVGA